MFHIWCNFLEPDACLYTTENLGIAMLKTHWLSACFWRFSQANCPHKKRSRLEQNGAGWSRLERVKPGALVMRSGAESSVGPILLHLQSPALPGTFYRFQWESSRLLTDNPFFAHQEEIFLRNGLIMWRRSCLYNLVFYDMSVEWKIC